MRGRFAPVVVNVILAGSAVLSMAFAGPKIEVTETEFNAGELKEGTVSAVTHEFKVKNIGDSVVIIRDVRPG
jgi:hypothetical protein